MSRMYVASFGPTAFTTVVDFFEILAASTHIIRVHAVSLYQTTELGDAMEEIVRVQTTRGVGSVTSGSGGGAATVNPISNGEAASAATVEGGNTTRMAAGSGSLEVLEECGWNLRAPFERIYTPECRPVIAPGERWTIGLPAAPGDSTTIGGSLIFEELN